MISIFQLNLHAKLSTKCTFVFQTTEKKKNRIMSIIVWNYVYWKPTEYHLRTLIFLVGSVMAKQTLTLRNQEALPATLGARVTGSGHGSAFPVKRKSVYRRRR